MTEDVQETTNITEILQGTDYKGLYTIESGERKFIFKWKVHFPIHIGLASARKPLSTADIRKLFTELNGPDNEPVDIEDEYFVFITAHILDAVIEHYKRRSDGRQSDSYGLTREIDNLLNYFEFTYKKVH